MTPATLSPEIASASSTPEPLDLTVADAVWIIVAEMHYTAKSDAPFSTEDIVKNVEDRHLTRGQRKSIWQHVNQHCVANREAQPNRACMLYAMGRGDRRLFRDSDTAHPSRRGGRMHPDWNNLPVRYSHLREWYEVEWNHRQNTSTEIDPLLALAGTITGLWGTDGPDAYVTSLRSGWESTK